MAANFEQIVVGANGQVHVAPTTAVIPTTADGSFSGDWLDLGTISEDGATLAVSKDITSIGAWQSLDPVRRIVTGRTVTVSFVCREWNVASVEFAFGTTIAGGGGTNEVQAVVLSGFGGTDEFKLTYAANESAAIVRGTNFTADGIATAIEGITGVTFTVTVSDVTDEGFIVTFDDQATHTALSVTSGTGGTTGVVGTLIEGAAPGGSDYTATPIGASEIDERALAVSWQDGTKDYRLIVPRGLVTGSTSTQLVRTGAADIPVEFSATPTAGGDAFSILSNDPALA